MGVPIPAGVSCAYNGVVFPACIKTRLTETPVTSGDNRVVKGSQLNISVSGYLLQSDADAMADAPAGMPLDALMLRIRRRLQAHGKNLVYVNKGYGADLDINNPVAGAGIRDIAMGPKAGKFTWWPMGGAPDGSHAAGFQWDVTATIAECGRFPVNPGDRVFTELSFTASYEVGEDGLVVITYSGRAEIPLSLQANNTLLRNIDDALSQPGIIRPVPLGFMRKFSRQLSADRGSCTFTITDRQVEVPYPKDVVMIDMDETMTQAEPMKPLWNVSFTATVRLSPTADKYSAWREFGTIVAARLARIRNQAAIPPTANGNGGSVPIVLPGVMRMRENLFKNEASFAVNARVSNLPMWAIIRKSGMWRRIWAIPQEGAQISHDSLKDNAQNAYGLISARFDNDQEIILDICAGEIQQGGIGGGQDADEDGIGGGGDDDEPPDDLIDPDVVVMGGMSEDTDPDEVYPAESSWLAWECTPRRITDYNVFRHKPLSGAVQVATPPVDPLGKVQYLADYTKNPDAGWSAEVPDIIQQTAAPSMMLRLTGFGVRVGRRVNPPKLVTYGGLTPTLKYEDVSEHPVAAQGVTIYRTRWDLVYLIPTAPQSLPLVADPVLSLDGG